MAAGAVVIARFLALIRRPRPNVTAREYLRRYALRTAGNGRRSE